MIATVNPLAQHLLALHLYQENQTRNRKFLNIGITDIFTQYAGIAYTNV